MQKILREKTVAQIIGMEDPVCKKIGDMRNQRVSIQDSYLIILRTGRAKCAAPSLRDCLTSIGTPELRDDQDWRLGP